MQQPIPLTAFPGYAYTIAKTGEGWVVMLHLPGGSTATLAPQKTKRIALGRMIQSVREMKREEA